MQEEVSQKSRQLAALYERYRSRRAEAGDLAASFQAEREDLLADTRSLSQAIKLKALVIDSYIPQHYQDLITSLCEWREYEETWAIAHVNVAGALFQSAHWPVVLGVVLGVCCVCTACPPYGCMRA